MTEITSRFDRLDTLIADSRLVRLTWAGTDAQGRDTACLLAALSPEAGKAEDASACPADVMPKWLALLTPWLDDSGTVEAWPSVVRRYAALARRWHALDETRWARLHWQTRGIIVREALTHTSRPDVVAACERIIRLCDSGAESGRVDEAERRAAAASADAAAYAAYAASAASAAYADAGYAAAYAAYAASAASAAAAASAAYAASARQKASDRMINQILSALEAACDELDLPALTRAQK